jgi:paraquat-inducible protein B
MQGDLIDMPSQGGGLENLTDTLSQIANKLSAIPFDKLGNNADDLLTSLHTLADTANAALKPLGTELPQVSQRLQAVLQNANKLIASIQSGYGASSDTHQNLQALTSEATEAVRSIRELTNYLDNHPGAVVWGRK